MAFWKEVHYICKVWSFSYSESVYLHIVTPAMCHSLLNASVFSLIVLKSE